MFDPSRLAKAAKELSDRIAEHKDTHGNELAGLISVLEPIVDRAKKREIDEPLDCVPGGRSTIEGELDAYPDLRSALSKFQLLARLDHDEYDKLHSWASKVRDEVIDPNK